MNLRNTNKHYSMAVITIHWLTVLLFIAVYVCIEFPELFPKVSDPHQLLIQTFHFMLGLTVLLLVSIRIAVRFSAGLAPAIEPEPPAWQQSIAKIVHLMLYGFMITQPLLGWLMLSAFGEPIPFFGHSVPPLIEENESLGATICELHKTIGNLGYILIGGHALAALFHHYFQHDNTLLRMMPKGETLITKEKKPLNQSNLPPLILLASILLLCGVVASKFEEMEAPVIVAKTTQPTPPDAGWYAKIQSDRGRALYTSKCQGCHGTKLDNGSSPALVGPQFFKRYGGGALSRLRFDVHTEMPINAPTTMPMDQSLDLVAYILRQNGFPAGSRPLARHYDMKRILPTSAPGGPDIE